MTRYCEDTLKSEIFMVTLLEWGLWEPGNTWSLVPGPNYLFTDPLSGHFSDTQKA